jgi:hypothetical protein
MSIRQHYYTSCSHPETARKGFQVKAVTPGIDRHTEEMLGKLLVYRPPNNADQQDLATHPVSLRYYAPEHGDALLICAQSNGSDEFGRPGNFFSHSLIGPAEAFNDPLPPIFYWRSPFWVMEDPSNNTELPAIEEMGQATKITFDYGSIWLFLSSAKRKKWFYKLVCAVLDHAASNRRIVIVDSNENTALWIALVTLALPHQYRPMLSFATYHHDPYNVPFLITGTTTDSNFRCTADEYRSYFILNVPENRISETPDSAYARYVCDRFAQQQYEEDVIPMHELIMRHDPAPAHIHDGNLVYLTHFYQLQTKQETRLSSRQITDAAHLVVADVLKNNKTGQKNVQDLRAAWEMLADEIGQSGDSALLDDYLSSMEHLRDTDPTFGETCATACAVLGRMIITRRDELITPLRKSLSTAYSPDVLQTTASDAESLAALVEQLQSNDMGQVLDFWHFYGPLLTYSDTTFPVLEPAFRKTCQAADHNIPTNPLHIPPETEHMLKAWLRTQQNPAYVTQVVTEYKQLHSSSPVLEWVYYAWIEEAPLDSRKSLRDAFSVTNPHIVMYELQRDLQKRRTSPEAIASVVADWIRHAHVRHKQLTAREAVEFVWRQPDIDHNAVAGYLLRHEAVVLALDEEWQLRLLECNREHLQITVPDPATVSLYAVLLARDDDALSLDLRATMEGSMLLATGDLANFDPRSLIHRYRLVNAETYREEASLFLERFFTADVPAELHGRLVHATFSELYRSIFWEIYWQTFDRLLLQEEQANAAIHALDFWFSHSHQLGSTHRFIVPEFFLGLRSTFNRLAASKLYGKAGPDFEAELQEMPWFSVIQNALPEQQKSRGLLRSLFER